MKVKKKKKKTNGVSLTVISCSEVAHGRGGLCNCPKRGKNPGFARATAPWAICTMTYPFIFTTKTRIHFVFSFLFKFGSPSKVLITKALTCTRKQYPDSGKMTPRANGNLVPRAFPSKNGWGAPTIFWGKSPGDEVGANGLLHYVRIHFLTNKKTLPARTSLSIM